MKERLSKLLCMKSIVTLASTTVFCILAIRGTISGQEFLTIVTTFIAFYFGTQKVKEGEAEKIEVIPVEPMEPDVIVDGFGRENKESKVD